MVPIYPILLSILMPLMVWVENVAFFNFSEALRFLFLSVGAVLALFLLFIGLLGCRHSAALVTFSTLVVFYIPVKESFQAVVLLGMLSLIVYFCGRLKIPSKVSTVLNIIALIQLVSITVIHFQVIATEFISHQSANLTESGNDSPFKGFIDQSPKKPLPSIYHLILDGYSSSKILSSIYQFDNSEFDDALRKLGFLIAEDSFSAYPETTYSISSTYLGRYWRPESDSVYQTPNRNSSWRDRFILKLGGEVSSGALVQLLKSIGYRFSRVGYSYVSFWKGHELENKRRQDRFPNMFEQTMLSNTIPGKVFQDQIEDWIAEI